MRQIYSEIGWQWCATILLTHYERLAVCQPTLKLRDCTQPRWLILFEFGNGCQSRTAAAAAAAVGGLGGIMQDNDSERHHISIWNVIAAIFKSIPSENARPTPIKSISPFDDFLHFLKSFQLFNTDPVSRMRYSDMTVSIRRVESLHEQI